MADDFKLEHMIECHCGVFWRSADPKQGCPRCATVEYIARVRRIRAEVEAMDWPEVIGE